VFGTELYDAAAEHIKTSKIQNRNIDIKISTTNNNKIK
jgi:hypothetical protein